MSPLAFQREAGIIRTVYVNISTTDAQSQGVQVINRHFDNGITYAVVYLGNTFDNFLPIRKQGISYNLNILSPTWNGLH